MEKATTLNVRVNPMVKARAEEVLSKLGVPMSTAINMYLNQISLTGGIPFAVTLPQAPNAIDMDKMTEAQLHGKLARGLADVEKGNLHDAAEVFARYREKRER